MQRWLISVVIFVTAFYGTNGFSAKDSGPIRILSIDGGGVRGIIPAVVLEKLQQELNQPIHEIFDFLAGSSTGGIIAIALASPGEHNQARLTPTDMVNLYITNSKTIFSSSTAHFVRNLGGLIGPRYETRGLQMLLDHNLGTVRLSQSLVPLLVTGYHIEGESGIEFFSEDAKEFPFDKDCMMKDVAMATAAAPAYFDSIDIPFPWGTLRNIADGGLYKHNPALLAYVSAKKMYPNRKIEVYSLGTGRISAESLDSELKGRGLLQWIMPILGHLQLGGSEADSSLLEKLLNTDGEQNYFRIDVKVDQKHSRMDKTSNETLRYLYRKGEQAATTMAFKLMVRRLKSDAQRTAQ